MPIEGATATEDGGKGSELVEFDVSAGFGSAGFGLHVLFLFTGSQYRPQGGLAGHSAEASDAIPKKRAKQRTKETRKLLICIKAITLVL